MVCFNGDEVRSVACGVSALVETLTVVSTKVEETAISGADFADGEASGGRGRSRNSGFLVRVMVYRRWRDGRRWVILSGGGL